MCLQNCVSACTSARLDKDLWRAQGVKRGVGLKRALALQEAARQSIGLTEGSVMAREELRILLTQAEVMANQLETLWARLLDLLQGIPGTAQMLTVPGVGPVTVAGFLAEVCDPTQYAHWRQVQKLADYNLKDNRSGEHKGQTRITKRGRPRLQALLYRCVVPMLVHNAEFRALHAYYTTRPDNPLKKEALPGGVVRSVGARLVHAGPSPKALRRG